MEQNQLLNFIIKDQYYFVQFEKKKKKASEITLRARTLVISRNVQGILFYKYLISILFSFFCFSQLKKEQ